MGTKIFRTVLAALVAVLAAPAALAANQTWLGNTSGSWNTASNWVSGTAPVNNDSLFFGAAGSAGGALTNNYGNLVGLTITFNSGASAFTVSGSSMSMSGNINNNSSNTQTFNNNITFATNSYTLVTNASGGNLVMNGNLTTGNVNVSNGAAASLSGTVTLGGTNTALTQVTMSNNGTLQLSSTGALSGGFKAAANTAGATTNLLLSSDSPITIGSVAYGANAYDGGNQFITLDRATAGAAVNATISSWTQILSRYGAGNTVTIQKGANVTSGTSALTVNGATTLYGSTQDFGAVTNTIAANDVNVTFNGGFSPATSAQTTQSGANSRPQTLGLSGSNSTNEIKGVIADAPANGSGVISYANITKSGPGTWILSGSNTYTGVTRVNDGTLQLGNGGVTGWVGSTSSVILGSTSANLVFARTDGYGGNFDRVISGTGNIRLASGTLALTGVNTYSGTSTLSAGVVNLGSAETAGTSGPLGKSVAANAGSIVLAGGTLQYSASNANDYSGRFSTAANQAYNVDTNGRNVTWASNLSSSGGVLSKVGSGTLTLSGSNSLSGGVTVGLGQLLMSNANALGTGTATVAGGELNIGSYAPTVGGFAITSGSLTGSGTFTSTNGYSLQGGAINPVLGTGAITVSTGTTTLGSAGRFNSASVLTVSNGQLTLGGNETVASYAQSGGSLGGMAKLTAATYGLGGGTVTANLGSGTINVTANSALNGTSDATTVNLNAGSLTLGSGGTRFTSSSVAVSGSAGASLTLGGNETFGSLGGAANIAVGASTLSVGGLATSTTYSGNLSGLGILAKLGSGTLTLSGNNSHSGGTQIANGTLRLGSSSALPTSSAVTLGTGSTAGVLEFNSNTATLGSITFNGSGSQLGTGTGGKLNLLASGTNNATITVTSGSHILHPDTSLQSNTVLDINAGAIFTLHGVIDGSKSLTKLGSGTLAISGNNSLFSGGAYLNGGYVNALNTGALGTGTVTIDGNTILNLNNTIFSNAVVFGSGSGAIINAGSLVNVSGTYSITSGTGTSITTNYNVQAGGDISFANNLASTVQVQNGAVGTFTADVLGGGGVTVYAGGRGVFSGSVTGPITTSGSADFSGSVLGNVTVGGGNATFAGPTDAASTVNVDAGLGLFTGTIGGIAHATAAAATIEIRNRVLSTADVNAEAGGTVKLMGSQAFDATTIDNGGSVIVDRTANLALAAVISGTGSLTKSDSRTLTLTGNNTYSGLTTISGGTLSVGNGGTSGGLTGNVLNNAALLFNRSNDTSYAGNISGSGAVTKLGAGKLTLTGSSSYSGGTTVEGGILSVNGQIGGNAVVLAGGTLGGSGSVGGVLSGAGLVSPGNSPGILTASQFDPSGGLGAAFEFTALSPIYTSATGSLNDVLRLTNAPNPFASGTFTSANVIDVYFNVGSITSGQTYEGGFFTEISAASLLAALDGKATFHYWAKTTGTSVDRSFNGFDYVSLTSLSGITGVTFQTAGVTRNFGTGVGDVTGSVTQFVIIPEPDTIVFAGIGIAMAGWSLWKRRRTARMLS